MSPRDLVNLDHVIHVQTYCLGNKTYYAWSYNAFVPRRLILDNTIVAFETVPFMK